MKLQRRERILAGGALGLVGLGALWLLLLAGDSRSADQLLRDRDKLTAEIADKQKQIEKADREAKRLADWQRRALPPDFQLARSKYQDWLRSLAASTNFRSSTLSSNDVGGRREHEQFAKISFTLHAKAKLGDVVEFMYKFYSAGLLHQIHKMSVKPVQSSRDVEVSFSIEALSLPTAVSKTQLSKEAGRGLKFTNLADYRDPIVKRDFFAAYRPAPPDPPPRRRETIDPAQFTVVTGLVEVDGAAQVWLLDKMKGKQWKLRVGETYSVGSKKGTVEAIRPQEDATVEFDGQRRILRLGDDLRGGGEIQDTRPKPAREDDNSSDSDTDEDN